MRRGLEASGYRVHWGRACGTAYDRACSVAYDALILDLMLPDMDGVTLLRALRDMLADGPPTVLKVLAAFNKELDPKKINLSRTYTDEFVKAALKKQ